MASSPDAAPSSPPDWENVPFAVCCARCGHDVHGQSESMCPACGLVFDWADAVPVEKPTCRHCGYHLYGLRDARCPECGTGFTWDDALLRYRASQKRLFEYQCRNAPIRSFVRTWLHALIPGRFWKSMDIHDPPQTRPLLIMVSLGLFVILIQLAVLNGVDAWVWNVTWQRTASGWVQQSPKFADLPLNLLKSAGNLNSYLVIRSLLPWLVVSFFSLLLFPQSMRMARVRLVHVVRVWAHALLPTVPLVIAASFIYSAACALTSTWYRDSVDGICAGIVLGHVLWSTRCAYKFYLHMPHAIWIAFASQVIAVLGGGFVETALANNITNTLVYKLYNLFGYL